MASEELDEQEEPLGFSKLYGHDGYSWVPQLHARGLYPAGTSLEIANNVGLAVAVVLVSNQHLLLHIPGPLGPTVV